MQYERAPVTQCKSRIDGKLINIRHASEGDLLYIREKLKELGSTRRAEDYAGYVVADKDGELLGFGVVTEEPGGMKGYSVHVASEHGYLADTMVKHLIEQPRLGP
ncbi:MAG: hypothetical protein P8Y77_09675 [Nitrospirota bacterium]|jgi:N-acetylglutamate synthase-like GNAT family acetyltransferase